MSEGKKQSEGTAVTQARWRHHADIKHRNDILLKRGQTKAHEEIGNTWEFLPLNGHILKNTENTLSYLKPQPANQPWDVSVAVL